MRFVLFVTPQLGMMPGVMPMDKDIIQPLEKIFPQRGYKDLLAFIRTHTKEDLTAIGDYLSTAKEGIALEEARLLSPIETSLHDILCVGLNYVDHILETKGTFDPASPKEKTVYFGKRALKILGSGEDINGHLRLDDHLDYEAELAIILGKTGCDIEEDKAEDYIFGYSVFNDVSARRLQKGHKQWLKGKSLDGFSVMGPWIVHKSALPLPLNLQVMSFVNGERRQNSNTNQMITAVPQIISELSEGMTLESGDIIATGTPSGVGMGFNPRRFMKAGDVVGCEITGIGKITNRIK